MKASYILGFSDQGEGQPKCNLNGLKQQACTQSLIVLDTQCEHSWLFFYRSYITQVHHCRTARCNTHVAQKILYFD